MRGNVQRRLRADKKPLQSENQDKISATRCARQRVTVAPRRVSSENRLSACATSSFSLCTFSIRRLSASEDSQRRFIAQLRANIPAMPHSVSSTHSSDQHSQQDPMAASSDNDMDAAGDDGPPSPHMASSPPRQHVELAVDDIFDSDDPEDDDFSSSNTCANATTDANTSYATFKHPIIEIKACPL